MIQKTIDIMKRTSLSKSRYTKYCQCPKALWLSTYKPEEATVDPAVEARFVAGNEVGDLAMGLFGHFVEVTTHTADGKLDLTEMVRRTQEEMDRGTEIICEASFAFRQLCLKRGADAGGMSYYCAVDILRRTPDGWDIYEVKSTTSNVAADATDKDFEKYAVDIAYQRWVLERCGVKVTGTYLVTLNKDYVRQGELDVQQLFNIIDLKELVDNEYLKVSAQAVQAHQLLAMEDEPDTLLSENCHKPYPCAFWPYCTRHLPVPSVFDVYGGKGRGGFTFKKKLDCYNQGLISFEQIAHLTLGNIQDMQIRCTLDNKDHIDKQGIRNFLSTLTYPLYFLDFESMQPVLPLYDGTRPYMQICFQYSLHYIEHEGGELKHTAFLAPSDGTDPRRSLAEALCRDIPQGVCTMVYNDVFEKSRIREMAEAYPDLATHLMNIRDNIIDLLIPFRRGHYYTPAMGGSFSIKKVLPALFPDDEELNYHNLNQLVQNGGDAMTIFPKIKDMSTKEAEEARQALLAYCHLDTLAMVRVWEKLKKIV